MISYFDDSWRQRHEAEVAAAKAADDAKAAEAETKVVTPPVKKVAAADATEGVVTK